MQDSHRDLRVIALIIARRDRAALVRPHPCLEISLAISRRDGATRVLRTVCTHVAHIYGGMPSQAPRRGGLAPWQVRRAKELLTARIDGEISLAELAQECDLSVSHFTRAFRCSTACRPTVS